MKKTIMIGIAFVLGFELNANEKEQVKSTITEVTVYTQGAQIQRKGNFSVKPGLTEIIIDDVCPNIDSKTIQVKASGNIVILDSKYSLYYPKPNELTSMDKLPLKIRREIKLTEDTLSLILFEIQEIQDEIDVLNATKSILSSNGAMKGQGKVNDSIQLLKEAVEYYTLKMNELNKQLQKLNRKKIDKSAKKNEVANRLNELKNYESNFDSKKANGPIHRITITVSSKELVSGKFQLSYLVNNAGWNPLYDIKSDIQTGKVNLNYKAEVYQNTGIDWHDVRLTISTNNPYQNKTKPTLHPWYVDYYTYKPQIINRKESSSPSLSSGASQSRNKVMEDESFTNYDARTAAEFTKIVDQIVSAEFKIDLSYTIASNNEKHLVLVSNNDLNANFVYYTVPKMDASVYLVAQISKLDELQLIPAKANIFFDGTYIGETYINPSTMDDTLSLSLGKDPNLIVKRTLLKKESKERIIGSHVEKINSYEIEIKSLKSSSVKIIVQDQIPITQNSDITIEATNLGRGNYKPSNGMLEWEINLKAKETKNIQFGYKIKFNKDQNIALN
jgi:uncharacterized protein (TIGR02231 family)